MAAEDPGVDMNAAQPVTIQRQPDGRHAVIGSDGTVLGQHKSIWSAARQIHEYHSAGTDGTTNGDQADIHPPVPRPKIPKVSHKEEGRPAKDRPSIPRPR